VTVYEKSERIGGLWPISKTNPDGMVNPDMCTNQSRHTVSFSDLAWEEDARSFLKAWEVGRYLERYRAFFGVHVECGVRVVSTLWPFSKKRLSFWERDGNIG